jgi:hypothetical protein
MMPEAGHDLRPVMQLIIEVRREADKREADIARMGPLLKHPKNIGVTDGLMRQLGDADATAIRHRSGCFLS